jgi:hypothetical protein
MAARLNSIEVRTPAGRPRTHSQFSVHTHTLPRHFPGHLLSFSPLYLPGGEIRSKFSIDDDSEDEEAETTPGASAAGAQDDLGSAVVARSPRGEILVDLTLLRSQPAIKHTYQCSEVASGLMFPSWLILTPSSIIKLRELQGKDEHAAVMWKRPLTTIVKVTAKKKHPTLLTFVYVEGAEPAAGTLAPEKSNVATTLVKAATPSSTAPLAKEAANAAKPGDDGTFALDDDDVDTNAVAEPDAPTPAQEEEENTTTNHADPEVDATTEKPQTPINADREEKRERYLVPEAKEAKVVLRDMILAAREAANLPV